MTNIEGKLNIAIDDMVMPVVSPLVKARFIKLLYKSPFNVPRSKCPKITRPSSHSLLKLPVVR